jgi:hypothetical protein
VYSTTCGIPLVQGDEDHQKAQGPRNTERRKGRGTPSLNQKIAPGNTGNSRRELVSYDYGTKHCG